MAETWKFEYVKPYNHIKDKLVVTEEESALFYQFKEEQQEYLRNHPLVAEDPTVGHVDLFFFERSGYCMDVVHNRTVQFASMFLPPIRSLIYQLYITIEDSDLISKIIAKVIRPFYPLVTVVGFDCKMYEDRTGINLINETIMEFPYDADEKVYLRLLQQNGR